MKTINKKNKKPQVDFQVQDEFELSDQEQPKTQNKIKDKKSIGNIYEQLLSKKKATQQNPQQQQKSQSRKQKKVAKRLIKKEQIKKQIIVKKEKKQAKKAEQKFSSSMKHINNKLLEDQLRKTTLKGVAKIFNLIVNHRKQIES